MQTTPATRRYRVTLLPKNVAREDAELKADQGVLPYLQFRSVNSGQAMQIAHQVTGLAAIRAERFEPAGIDIGAAAAQQRRYELTDLSAKADMMGAAA